jgi:hypothetical protein
VAGTPEAPDSGGTVAAVKGEEARLTPMALLGLALAVVCIFASAQGAWAATATEQLKSAIDRVLATIDNPR